MSNKKFNKEVAIPDKRILKYAINGLGFVTGIILYLVFYVLSNESYLNPNDNDYFQRDLKFFVLTIFIVLFIGFVWFKLYKQFKKDKTELGFSNETNGYILILTILIEVAVSIFIFFIF